MKPALYFACIIFLFHSCDGGIADLTSGTGRPQDTSRIETDSALAVSFADSLPSGAYQGIFPCKGCKGIQQTIFFNDDKSYQQEQIALEKDAARNTSGGSWQFQSDTIELSQNNKVVLVLIKKTDTLLAITVNGASVADPYKYILLKRNLAASNPGWSKKRVPGVNFAGVGNEPSWTVEINNKKFIRFNLAAWKKAVIAPVTPPVINKDSILYTMKSDTTNWTVTIFPQFCSDGMSDYLYQYKVNVKYKGVLYKGCGIMFDKKDNH